MEGFVHSHCHTVVLPIIRNQLRQSGALPAHGREGKDQLQNQFPVASQPGVKVKGNVVYPQGVTNFSIESSRSISASMDVIAELKMSPSPPKEKF